jgi:hypothetical protein
MEKVPPIQIHVATMILLNVQNKICYINIVLNLIISEFRIFLYEFLWPSVIVWWTSYLRKVH